MKVPPYLLKIGFRNYRHSLTLWLPLFLLGPLFLVFLLAVFLILLPFALLAMLLTWRTDWLRTLSGMLALLRLLCYLPGLKVDVEGRGGHIYVAFL